MHDSTHEGWPVLKNARGWYCYRHVLKDRWRLGVDADHKSTTCWANIVAKEGPLPVGAHTWDVSGEDDWEDRMLTVTLLPTEAAVLASLR